MDVLRFGLATATAGAGIAWTRFKHGPTHPEWSWRVEFVAGMLRYAGRYAGMASPQRLRRTINALGNLSPTPRGVDARWTRLAGLETLELTPRQVQPGTLLYFHGGGYVICSPNTHRLLVGRIARAAKIRALVPTYRLAPEHPFPAAIDDCVAAYRALLAVGTTADSVVLGGDSAGGGLVLATLIRLRDAGDPLPAGALLVSPWLDLSLSSPTIDAHAPYDYLNREILTRFRCEYLGAADPCDPLASPLYADLQGLPPLLVQAGGAEALRGEIEAFTARARSYGVQVTLELWPGMLHAWEAFSEFLPEGKGAILEMGRFLRARLEHLHAPEASAHG